MFLAPLLAAPAVIQAHAFAAMAAFLIGLVQFAAPKGTLPHRSLGWIWVLLMAGVALSSFWITGVAGAGHFSWIHALSVVTLVALVLAVRAARGGRIRAHQRAMTIIFLGALMLAGVFTLLPGRIMHRVLFGN
ncbi:MAG: DUF2306 domain-containing protein [Acetobacteraceae bacterium]|nr:DUF2306 domain-containing protein [Acetobacteraceae bacterium]